MPCRSRVENFTLLHLNPEAKLLKRRKLANALRVQQQQQLSFVAAYTLGHSCSTAMPTTICTCPTPGHFQQPRRTPDDNYVVYNDDDGDYATVETKLERARKCNDHKWMSGQRTESGIARQVAWQQQQAITITTTPAQARVQIHSRFRISVRTSSISMRVQSNVATKA